MDKKVVSIKLFQEVRHALDRCVDRAAQVESALEALVNGEIDLDLLPEYGYHDDSIECPFEHLGRFRPFYVKPLSRVSFSLRVPKAIADALSGIEEWQDKLRRYLLDVFYPDFQQIIPTMPAPKKQHTPEEDDEYDILTVDFGKPKYPLWWEEEEVEEEKPYTALLDCDHTKKFFVQFPTYQDAFEDGEVTARTFVFLKLYGHYDVDNFSFPGMDGEYNDEPDKFLSQFVQVSFEGNEGLWHDQEIKGVTDTGYGDVYYHPVVKINDKDTLSDESLLTAWQVWQKVKEHLARGGVIYHLHLNLDMSKLRKIEGINYNVKQF